MKFSRIRLLIVIIGGSILMTSIFGYLIIRMVKEMNADQIKREYEAFQYTMMLQESMVYDRLVESSYLLAENSTFKANLQLNDISSLNYSAKDFALFMKVDLFTILDKNGNAKFDLHNNFKSTQSLSNYPAVDKALMGSEPPIEYTSANLFFLKDNIYQVVAVPVFAGKNKIIGAIIMGVKFWDFIVEPLAKSTPFTFTLLHKNKQIGSTNGMQNEILMESSNYHSTKNVNSLKTEKEFRYIKNNGSKSVVFTKSLNSAHTAELISVIPQNKFLKHNFWQNNFFITAIISLLFFNLIVALFSWKLLGQKPNS